VCDKSRQALAALRDLRHVGQELDSPVLGDGGFGRVAELSEEVSALFKFRDGPAIIARDELLPARENIFGPEQQRGLLSAGVRVEAG